MSDKAIFKVMKDNLFIAADDKEALPKGFTFETLLKPQYPESKVVNTVLVVGEIVGVTFSLAMVIPLLL